MAYDERLAERVRELLASHGDLSERKMFGGLAFLLAGNMAVAVDSRMGLMVRCEPDEVPELLDAPGVEQVEMRGRPMTGWIHVTPHHLVDDDDLTGWVQVGVERARDLPPKR